MVEAEGIDPGERPEEGEVAELHLLVGGMGCRHCVREVSARLRDVRGVERVVADALTNRVMLTGAMRRSDVMDALSGTPFLVRVLTDELGAASGDGRGGHDKPLR